MSHSVVFNDPGTPGIYTLSLHDALPILQIYELGVYHDDQGLDTPYLAMEYVAGSSVREDRKSTRLNSSHTVISYAVFCLKKKKTTGVPRHSRDRPSLR